MKLVLKRWIRILCFCLHTRKRKQCVTSLFIILALYLVQCMLVPMLIFGDYSINQTYVFRGLCKEIGINTCEKLIQKENNSPERNYLESADEFTRITLSPDVAKQLNCENVSKRTYALTIDRPYLIENPDICKAVENLTVIVVVHSAVTHFEHRRIIRETWTNNTYFGQLGTVRVVFLLGRDNAHRSTIKKEFVKYGDIVQGDFIDAYRNMTHKNIMGYKWLSTRCQNAKVILKVDDDVVIDMFYFLSTFTPYFLSKPNHMACVRLKNIKVKRKGKWAVERSLFRKKPLYPEYCQGFMVVISNDIIRALYKSATITPFFWIDDVHAYGMVPGNIPEIEYTRLEIGKHVAWRDSDASHCYRQRIRKCSFFVVLCRGLVTKALTSIWSKMVLQHRKYPTNETFKALTHYHI